jgi:hypothetical protein
MSGEATRVAAMLLTAALVVALGEYATRGIVDAPVASDRVAGTMRATNVRTFAKDPDVVPVLSGRRPTLLLIGNSHTYALPGLAPGRPLRPDPGRSLVDRLAARAPVHGAAFDRLAYPNFLPFEMLTRVAQLDLLGYRPRVVVIGVTWRNLARDTALRHEIQGVYRDPVRARAERALLASPEVTAAPAVLAAVDDELRFAAEEAERARTRSLADRFDDRATRWLGERVTLLGRSADLRARLYRSTAHWVQGRLAGTGNTYDVIAADLAFNLACFRALVQLLHAHGAQVVIYWAPERTDLPPMMDRGPQEAVMAELTTWTQALGGTVIDARATVPNAYWGWERDTPDRSHFTEPGHDALAAFIVAHMPPSTWETLARP